MTETSPPCRLGYVIRVWLAHERVRERRVACTAPIHTFNAALVHTIAAVAEWAANDPLVDHIYGYWARCHDIYA